MYLKEQTQREQTENPRVAIRLAWQREKQNHMSQQCFMS